MNWDIGIDVYTLLYIKHISNENLLHSTSVLCVDLNVKGKKKKKGGGWGRIWLIHFAIKRRQLQLAR